MIRFAEAGDLSALSLLWQEAFDADEQEAAYYFKHRHVNENMLVALENGRLAGMLTMLPARLITATGALPVEYVFAVATFKAFRGQGISTRLLEKAHRHMEQKGAAASVLVPATPSLFNFYEKRGYAPYFYLDSLPVDAKDIPSPESDTVITPCEADCYLALRDAALSSHTPYVRWDKDALRYIISGFRAEGGGALRLTARRGNAACLYEMRDGGIRITELVLNGLSQSAALSALHSRLRGSRYLLRAPAGTLENAALQPFGMVRWFVSPPETQGNIPYLSLAKD